VEPGLTAASLGLRGVEPADAGRLAALMTPEISRWVADWPLPFTEAMTRARIAGLIAKVMAGDALAFGIMADAELVGFMQIIRDDVRRDTGKLGYWLAAAYHGRGYLRECLPGAIAAGFEQLGLGVVEGGAQVDNLASLAAMRRAGMVPIGERMVRAPARGRDELCAFYAIRRPA